MTPQEFQQVLASHKRIAIVGGPKTGKTTLAKTVTDRPVDQGQASMHKGHKKIFGDVLSANPGTIVYK
jgi:polynucleotide 5'-kinase involved in rRNA processing